MGVGEGSWQVPDYKKYKWEDIRSLRKYNAVLSQNGLKDPWIRNYVWRYLNPYTKNNELRWYQLWNKIPGVTKGMSYGAIAVGVYIAVDQVLKQTGVKSNDSHH